MLQPPEQFAQLKKLPWLAPLMTGLTVLGAVNSHGLASGESLWWLVGAAAVVAWVLAMCAVWGSAFGSRHQFCAVGAVFCLVVVPVATLFLPYLVRTGAWSGGRLSLLVVLVFLGLLLLSAWYHARRCPMPTDHALKVRWPHCTVNLAKQTVNAQLPVPASGVGGMTAAMGSVASVSVYHGLASIASKPQMVMIGVALTLAMALWLCLWPLGRALGQGWRLRQFEALRGVRVVSDRLPWLTKERQRHVVGRWWARTFD